MCWSIDAVISIGKQGLYCVQLLAGCAMVYFIAMIFCRPANIEVKRIAARMDSTAMQYAISS